MNSTKFIHFGWYILTKKQMDTIPITPGYLEICLGAASKISKEFAQDFIGTTYGL